MTTLYRAIDLSDDNELFVECRVRGDYATEEKNVAKNYACKNLY